MLKERKILAEQKKEKDKKSVAVSHSMGAEGGGICFLKRGGQGKGNQISAGRPSIFPTVEKEGEFR